jgi:hypothetical protein
LPPAAKHVVLVGQLMAPRASVVPEVCADHVLPPLVVVTIVPLAPTAQHDVVLTHATPRRSWLVAFDV